MIFCLPPLLIILIGPSIYGIAQNLAGDVSHKGRQDPRKTRGRA